MNNSSIHYSRAGDIFHYRWAAKRCLNFLDFDTNLQQITIEGSYDSNFAGEDVIDLAEYREDQNGNKLVEYFQLKHSTVNADTPFNISDLKSTIKGFTQRFIEHQNNSDYIGYKFTIITNRKISDTFKKGVLAIVNNEKPDVNFLNALKRYTKLQNTTEDKELTDLELQKLCSLLSLDDSHGNFQKQQDDLHQQLKQKTVLKNIFRAERDLVAKVWKKIEPYKSNIITQKDIFDIFSVLDINDFFPAPPKFENITNIIHRHQQDKIIQDIINDDEKHTIITATGGIGKSVFINEFKNIFTRLNNSHIVVTYDCFGNGGYRKLSEKRHRIATVVTQIINELARFGYCEQIIPQNNQPDEQYIKILLNRLSSICSHLQKIDKDALLIIAFDAVDNAVIASEEFAESCFANQLLREEIPQNCRFIFTCRPERINLLDIPSSIKPIELEGFSDKECFKNLKQYYPKVNIHQATEFNALTSKNPRVQANAIALQYDSL